MNRDQAIEELKKRVSNSNLIKHSLAVEAIMVGLSQCFNEDSEMWGLAGLLHDIDYDITKNTPSYHSLIGAEILEDLGVDLSVVYAVRAHNDLHNIQRRRKIDKALFSADPVSGLITACALILPSKKLKDVTVDFILKRFDENGFAKGANRENINKCSELGFTLDEFIRISLDSMKDISNELGL